MKMRAFALAALAIAASGGSPAAAQLAPGYSGSSGVVYAGEEEMWWSMRQMGECLSSSKADRARALLATMPNSAEERGASRALLGNSATCLRHLTRRALPTALLRGLMAEGLYESSAGAAGSALKPVPDAPVAERPAPKRALSLRSFARCFAARRPDEVHRLLTATRLGTREELAELSQVASGFHLCLPEGAGFNEAAPLVRVALAEALYLRLYPVEGQQGARR